MKFNTRDITTPENGLVCYKNSWWVCKDGDPTQALFFGLAPQCNVQKAICEWGIKNGHFNGYTVSAVFVETAFVPQRD